MQLSEIYSKKECILVQVFNILFEYKWEKQLSIMQLSGLHCTLHIIHPIRLIKENYAETQ